MNKIKFWQFILSKLNRGENVVLLTVLHNSGSSPGKPTFKMVATENKDLLGTIGGGVLEFNLVERAFNSLLNGKIINEIVELFHSNSAGEKSSGMICAGSQITHLVTITPTDAVKVKQIYDSLINNKVINLILSKSEFALSSTKINNEFIFNYKDTTDWNYTESLNYQNTIYIFGGGHVGKALANIMATLSFNIIIFDNRDNEVIKDCPNANKVIITDFELVDDYLTDIENSYVTILTHTHLNDKFLTKKLLTKNFKYIGLLGSRSKLKSLFNDLKNEGLDSLLLSKLHAPIGLEIGSNTAEEIAVSIAAEIIKVKNHPLSLLLLIFIFTFPLLLYV